MDNPLTAVITNVQRFSTEDGPGIRTTVFFKGCPLRCPWCHNPEGLSKKPELVFYPTRCLGCRECAAVCEHGAPVPGGPGSEQCVLCFRCAGVCPPAARQAMGEAVTIGQLVERAARDKVFFDKSGGGVTASGGEALVWAEFVAEFFARLQALQIHTALDTCGAVGGERLHRALDHTNLILLDLKILDEDRHRQIIGAALAPMLANMREMDGRGLPIIVRFPLVPGYTDDPANLAAAAAFAASLENLQRVEILPFHQLGQSKYGQLGIPYGLPELRPPAEADLDRAEAIFKAAGLNVLVAGRE